MDSSHTASFVNMDWPESGRLNEYPVASEGVLEQDPELPLQLPSFFSDDYVWSPRNPSAADDEFASPWMSLLRQTLGDTDDSPFSSPRRLPIKAPEAPLDPSYLHSPPNTAPDNSSPSYCTRLAELSLSPLSRPFSLPPTPSTSHGFPQQSSYPSPASSTPGLAPSTFLTSYSPGTQSPPMGHDEDLSADISESSPKISTAPLTLISHRKKRGRNDSAVQRQRKSSSVANFICDSCGVDFTTKGALGIHVKTKHGAEEYIVYCGYPSCGRSYRDKSSLDRHQKSQGHGQPKTHKRRRLRSGPTPE